MFHNHAYLLFHVGLKVPKGGGFYAYATNLTSLACLVERLDLTRFIHKSFQQDSNLRELITGQPY